MTTRSTNPLLDDAHAAFIQRKVSISVASRDAGNMPAVARAYGCRVSSDRRQVTVFLCPARAAKVLENLRDNGAIAVVFNEPSTHETIQLKGTSVDIKTVRPADRLLVKAHWDSFIADLTGIGYSEEFGRTISSYLPDDLVRVTFQPRGAFSQTPGQKAGQPLGGT